MQPCRTLFLPFFGFAVLIVLGGCSSGIPTTGMTARASEAPASRLSAPRVSSSDQATRDTEPQSGFFPLAVGNRWHYTRRVSLRFVPDEGPPELQYGYEHPVVIEIICSEDRSTYVQREAYQEPGRTTVL